MLKHLAPSGIKSQILPLKQKYSRESGSREAAKGGTPQIIWLVSLFPRAGKKAGYPWWGITCVHPTELGLEEAENPREKQTSVQIIQE